MRSKYVNRILLMGMLSLGTAALLVPAWRSTSAEKDALKRVLHEAKTMKADHLLVLSRGKPLIDWSSGKYAEPYQLMSITKSISSLAVGNLFEGGSIALTDRLDKFFPELRCCPQGQITVDQVLHHTSGLARHPLPADADDSVSAALDLNLVAPPGSEYMYNNVSVQLLSGLVERVTGDTLEAYARDHLFAPLGITKYEWEKDGAGHAYVAAFLALGPHDLGKIGQLIAQKGNWHGKQIVSAGWIEALGQPSTAWQFYGLLWWVGFSGNWFKDFNRPRDAQHTIWSNGASNQILAVIPRTGLVLVVQTEHTRRPAEESDEEPADMDPILHAFLELSSLR